MPLPPPQVPPLGPSDPVMLAAARELAARAAAEQGRQQVRRAHRCAGLPTTCNAAGICGQPFACEGSAGAANPKRLPAGPPPVAPDSWRRCGGGTTRRGGGASARSRACWRPCGSCRQGLLAALGPCHSALPICKALPELTSRNSPPPPPRRRRSKRRGSSCRRRRARRTRCSTPTRRQHPWRWMGRRWGRRRPEPVCCCKSCLCCVGSALRGV